MKLLLKLWIKLKYYYAKSKGWIHPIKDEIKFIKSKAVKELYDLVERYKTETFCNIQWDYQFDSIELFRRYNSNGEMDCNEINRAWQVYYNIQGFDSYLLTYTAKFKNYNDFVKNFEENYKTKNIIKTWGSFIIQYVLNKLYISLAHGTCIYKNKGFWYVADYGHIEICADIKQCIEKLEHKYRCKIKTYILQDINWKIMK